MHSRATIDEVLAADDARLAAMTRIDVDALAELLADELVFVHTNGRREDKTDYLAALRSGHLRYRSLERHDAIVQPAGDAAVITGMLALAVIVDGAERSAGARFLSVWLKRYGRWKMVACDMVRAAKEPSA